MTADAEVQELASALLYRCPVCGWWEGDQHGIGEAHCNGWPGKLHVVTVMEQVEVVPREVVERLTEALERIAARSDGDVAHHDHAQRLAASRAAEFRAVFPKAEET